MSALFTLYFYTLFTLTNSWWNPFSPPSNVETFQNIGRNVTITCGKDKDCTIICDQKRSCRDSTFNVEYGNIQILCSGTDSCRDVNILSWHTLSLNMTFTGSGAFTGHYWGYGDENVTVYCNGSWGCTEATFHYDSLAPVQHECNNFYACSDTTIHAVTEVNIICSDSDCSCYNMAVISATNNYTIKVTGKQYTYPFNPIFIFPTSALNMHKLLICDECKLDSILYIPAVELNRNGGCFASNTTCMTQMIDILHKQAFTVIDNYYSVDYPSSMTGDILFIHSKRPGTTNPVLTAPNMAINDDIFHVFCIECSGITFDLSATQNAVIRYFWKTSDERMSGSTIYGPTDSFQLVSNVDLLYNKGNKVHVNNTETIYIADVGYQSDLYVGLSLDVDIKCRAEYGCREVNIYSDIDPITSSKFVLFGDDGVWDISCYEGRDSCRDIYLHFSRLNKVCPYTANGPDTTECPFLKEISLSSTVIGSDVIPTVIAGDNGSGDGVPGYVWGIMIGAALVIVVGVFGYIYTVKKRKAVRSDIYAQLNEDNSL